MHSFKNLEGEEAKLYGQMQSLNQQSEVIQSAQFDVVIVKDMRFGNSCLRSLTSENGLDMGNLGELRDEIDENMQDMKDRNEFFADAIEEGQAELLAELDGLEAEAVADDFDLQNPANVPMHQNDFAQ